MRLVALLRGINVGGRSVIKMAELRPAFEGLGLKDVRTYIQSGNVVFTSEGSRRGLAIRFSRARLPVLSGRARGGSRQQPVRTRAPRQGTVLPADVPRGGADRGTARRAPRHG